MWCSFAKLLFFLSANPLAAIVLRRPRSAHTFLPILAAFRKALFFFFITKVVRTTYRYRTDLDKNKEDSRFCGVF